MKNNLKIEIVKWIDGLSQLKNIREKVFIQEQKVTPQLEWDGMDEKAIHFLVFNDKAAIGCARAIVIKDHMQLGRMAVLKEYRGQGIGGALIEKAMTIAKLNQLSAIYISAQCHAIDFYKKFGFEVTSDIYLDAEIPHRDMTLDF
ncbi:GNAT family N-acetyltransferase [Candidatus Methylopumilus universalis]|jgi:predicted GNAT family N-acyltransferase|uniref:GNAT family N-acetyltransferase n=1 Tax=Candidatus Methylopumilus universalis TaxID=2588536 RepID=UPI00111E9D8B|nr:GNAT family N-acetyltransferase [Candidatus Methylopumilus universalis]QDC47938.1 GNAT family N-acetyltransferase [Candidatus Methylopumilus universalis]QDC72465.1 GNAT family N-acetyltransferase [Candidatus Methylopumilus universalis]QDC98222.1 GNAT family N-acetyltransferase [Candidatus Methylopumilus universalis]